MKGQCIKNDRWHPADIPVNKVSQTGRYRLTVDDFNCWVGNEQLNRKWWFEILVGDIENLNIKIYFNVCYPKKY